MRDARTDSWRGRVGVSSWIRLWTRADARARAIRSRISCSAEYQFSSMGSLLAAHARVEPFEEGHAVCEHFVVIGVSREKPTDHHIDPARLISRELAVAKVRLVHDLGEPCHALITQPSPLHERFERAVLSDVAELGPWRIERYRVRREIVRIREQEGRVRIYEPLDEPGGCNAVHVGPSA